MTIEIKNPRYTAEDGEVTCDINHPKYGWLPFTASDNDVELYGRAIYQLIVTGQYGDIAPAGRDVFERLFEVDRNAEIERINQFCSNPLNWLALTPEQQQAAADYRAALLALTFETSNSWPVAPEFLK